MLCLPRHGSMHFPSLMLRRLLLMSITAADVQHRLYPLCGQSFLAHLLLCELSVGCSAESVGVWAWNVCPSQHGLLF